jgi:hypothetical protein
MDAVALKYAAWGAVIEADFKQLNLPVTSTGASSESMAALTAAVTASTSGLLAQHATLASTSQLALRSLQADVALLAAGNERLSLTVDRQADALAALTLQLAGVRLQPTAHGVLSMGAGGGGGGGGGAAVSAAAGSGGSSCGSSSAGGGEGGSSGSSSAGGVEGGSGVSLTLPAVPLLPLNSSSSACASPVTGASCGSSTSPPAPLFSGSAGHVEHVPVAGVDFTAAAATALVALAKGHGVCAVGKASAGAACASAKATGKLHRLIACLLANASADERHAVTASVDFDATLGLLVGPGEGRRPSLRERFMARVHAAEAALGIPALAKERAFAERQRVSAASEPPSAPQPFLPLSVQSFDDRFQAIRAKDRAVDFTRGEGGGVGVAVQTGAVGEEREEEGECEAAFAAREGAAGGGGTAGAENLFSCAAVPSLKRARGKV